MVIGVHYNKWWKIERAYVRHLFGKPPRARLSEVKRRLPAVTGTMASLSGHWVQLSVRVTLTGTRTSATGYRWIKLFLWRKRFYVSTNRFTTFIILTVWVKTQAAPQREETEWRVQSKRGLMPAYRGEAGQQVNIKIMEYSERNVRQLASNEQEEYIPRKINVGVINTPTLIRSDY